MFRFGKIAQATANNKVFLIRSFSSNGFNKDSIMRGKQIFEKNLNKIRANDEGPLSNKDIRQAYLETEKQIPHRLPVQEFEEGSPELASKKMREYGDSASSMRFGARQAAREHMPKQEEVENLKQRDLKKYGNPDGPSLGQLKKELEDKGLDKDGIALHLYHGAQKSSAEYTKKAGIISEQSDVPKIPRPGSE